MNSREIAFEILYDIFKNGAYSNISLNKHFKKYEIEDADKNLIKEIVFGTIERKYTIDYFISFYIKNKLDNLDLNTLIVLEMGIYQLEYLDKIPNYAVLNETVNLAKKVTNLYKSKFINAVLRNFQRKSKKIEFPDRNKDFIKYLCIKYSFPEWIVKRLVKNYPKDKTEKILIALNEKPEICFRMNSLKIEKEDFINYLKEHNIDYKEGYYNEEAFYLKIKDAQSNDLYKKGYIQVQDEASMLVSKVLSPKEGDFIIDVCSAPGGKTTHIAQLMNNEGTIVAFDVYKHKLKIIEDNCKRLGIKNVKTELFDATKINSKYINKADLVLTDVPCSGIGIIKKKPDIKLKRLSEQDILNLVEIQYSILNSSSNYVKVNGFLVYSTCTLGNEENMDIIEKFLNNNSNFILVDISNELKNFDNASLKKGFIQITPDLYPIDGFFICKMKRIK
ncbi:MAG: 16S rRNA (cytosine(967)-C(5))-methyltransferase RsmB [Thermoanaerobacteraceae bacterium]